MRNLREYQIDDKEVLATLNEIFCEEMDDGRVGSTRAIIIAAIKSGLKNNKPVLAEIVQSLQV